MTRATPDRDGLLASLVLAPGTFPRNRFYAMYRETPLAKARARAAELRGIVRTLLGARGAAELESRADTPQGARLIVRVPRLGLTVTSELSAFERDVVDVAVSIGRREQPPLGAKARVDVALARLAPDAARP